MGVHYETARYWGGTRHGHPQEFPRWMPFMMDSTAGDYRSAAARCDKNFVSAPGTTGNRMTTTDMTDKPIMIKKWRVYEAYKAVKSSKGAAGVDGQTIEQFEASLKGNHYKIWNRMSSGTYFPPPVRAVSIPKKSGGERILGVPP
jgi:hypothetical protein